MIKLLLPILNSLLLLSLASTAVAQDTAQEELKFYDVEIIIFKNNDVPRSHEYNLPTPSATPAENSLDLSNPGRVLEAADQGFTPLPADELQLQDKVQRLIKSSRYDLLLHTGWRQPGREADQSIPVWIKGGQIFGDGYSSIDQFSFIDQGDNGEVEPSTDNNRETIEESRQKGLYELEGQITISLSRYLHTRAELVLRKPSSPVEVMQQSTEATSADSPPLESLEGQLLLNYALNEQRRMRSKRLHYLDHPQFAMLVLITPYEAAEVTADTPAEAENGDTDSTSLENASNSGQ